MNGVRFYKDLNGAACPPEGKSYATAHNGCALTGKTRLNSSANRVFVCISSSKFVYGDGPYHQSAVSEQYMRANMVRISEARARVLFPKLLNHLEVER